MSRAIFDAPTTRPASSTIGDTVRETEHLAAVLAPAARLEVIDQSAGANPRQHHVLFRLELVGDNHAHRTADRFLGGVAEHAFGGPIPRHDRAVQILGDDGVVRGLDHGGEPLHHAIGVDAIADVARDLRRANDVAVVVVNGRHRQRNRNRRAVLSLTDGFVMPDRFALADLADHEILFALPIAGNDHADGAPDGLGRGVAEHAFGGGIPRQNRAVQILADNRVIGRVDDLGEMAQGQVRWGVRHRSSIATAP
jgi:hypothetical protein